MRLGDFALSPLGESPEMQLAGGKAFRQEGLGAARTALAHKGNTLQHRGAIYKYMYAIGEATTVGAPLDAQHTALIYSVLQPPGRSICAL